MASFFDNLVEIEISIASAGILSDRSGLNLHVVTDGTILAPDGAESVRSYRNLTAVTADWSAVADVMAAAKVYFDLGEGTVGPFQVGRMANAAAGARVLGAASMDLAALKAVSNPTFSIGSDSISSIDISSATTLTQVGTILAAAINAHADYTGVTVPYTAAGNRFSVQFPGTSIDAPAAVTGTLADAMGLTGGERQRGIAAAETVRQAAIKFTGLVAFDMLTLEKAFVDTATSSSFARLGTEFHYAPILDTKEAAAALASDSTSQLFLAARDKVPAVYCWDSEIEYQSLAVASFFSANSPDVSNDFENINNSELPGQTGTVITSDQYEAIIGKRGNVYRSYGSLSMFRRGTTCDPDQFISDLMGKLWLQRRLTNRVVQLMRGKRSSGVRKPSHNEKGLNKLVTAFRTICQQGVEAGVIEENAELGEGIKRDILEVTGVKSFDGILPSGYMLYAEPFSELTDEQRAAAVFPYIHAWIAHQRTGQVIRFKINTN